MDKAIYTAMTGAQLRMTELDNVAGNVANINTTGFKRTTFSSRLYAVSEGLTSPMKSLYPDARNMTVINKFQVDASQGTLVTTGNPLDLGIQGDGYFVVEAKGKRAYTRNGSFTMDKDGYLVTGSGYKVLSTDGAPIQLSRDAIGPTVVALDGTITQENNTVSTIKLARVTNIEHMSESLYSGTEGEASDAVITQGSIERSNVNPVRELIAMITAQREFQTLQQVIRTFDQLAQRTATDIARI